MYIIPAICIFWTELLQAAPVIMNNTLPTEADTQMERDNEMFPWYTLGNILYATYLKALDTSSKLYQTGKRYHVVDK